MKISGWGRYPTQESRLHIPASSAHARQLLSHTANNFTGIPRGAGLSYGDSALAPDVLLSRQLDQFIDWDEERAVLRCGAGLRLQDILDHFAPRGRFLPVLPGTGGVTVGGAIAADVHGKNHHRDGCFSDHVLSLTLLTADGETLHCSPRINRDVFLASCGGMGLTGFITEAELHLRQIPGQMIRQRALRTNNLEDSFQHLSEHQEASYSVAWLDCMARGRNAGRSILFLGEHSDEAYIAKYRDNKHLSVPFSTPATLLNRYSISGFNLAYYHLAAHKEDRHLHYRDYFFPLDKIAHWNRLYGNKGFLQYQCVLPDESALSGIRKILDRIRNAGKGSFLSVLKKFGPANDNFLSFPRQGYTLALDFKYQPDLLLLLDTLDAIVLDYGGRLYLAKDARMSREVFRRSYPDWERFQQLRETLGAHQRFNSLQSRRLGL